ncbi:MAG: prepilin-type N-terminal cleavage/methylation domain-containing protein [Planctomycetota bacterium]|nr:prepilin-type N-terminal cleavage/methylation domain-containing protein [Planctomycetota bacterium]
MREKRKRGFTLIELMVVVAIIAVLATMIIPALQRAQQQSLGVKCLSKARAIAGSIRTYSLSWDGWTNPHSDYYVKLFDYPIEGEPEYDTFSKATVDDFTCPADGAPNINRFGYPSSYLVTGWFAGLNLSDPNIKVTRSVAVKENEKRHPKPGSTDEKARAVVFVDMHGLVDTYIVEDSLGLRVWNFPNREFDANNNKSRGDEVSFTIEPTYEGELVKLTFSGAQLEGMAGEPSSFTLRGDGFFKFPYSGEWQFHFSHDDSIWFGLDLDFDGSFETEWVAPRRWVAYEGDFDSTPLFTVEKDRPYKFAIAYEQRDGPKYLVSQWSGPNTPQQEIPSSSLLHEE